MNQTRREKHLDKIIQRGEPEAFGEVQSQTKTLQALSERLKKIKHLHDQSAETQEA